MNAFRYIPLLGLLALVPIAAYVLDRVDMFVLLSGVSVVLIVGSLLVAFRGGAESRGSGSGH